MAEVTRGELALHPIHGLLKATHSHDPRVIDEDVESAYKTVDFRGGFTHRCIVGELALYEGYVALGTGFLDLLDDRVYFCPVAASEQKLAGIGTCKSLRNFGIKVRASLIFGITSTILILPAALLPKALTTSAPVVSRSKLAMMLQDHKMRSEG